MKKILILLIITIAPFPLLSQKSKVASASGLIDQGTLDKAKEYIDQALANEKTKDWPNTYFVKGNLCQAIFESNLSYYNDPLSEAFASYEKANELDLQGSTKKKIVTQMLYNKLAINLYKQGSSKFEKKDFEGALKSFETQIQVTENDKYVGSVDTGMYYNAALAASNAREFNAGIEYFEKCIDKNYLGSGPYYQIQACYLELGDTTKAESVLKDILEAFPDDENIYAYLINLSITSKKFQDAAKYANDAIKKRPDDFNSYYISGIVSLQQNEFDKAFEYLQKSTDLKPDYFDSQYALGICYINKAADMTTKANEISDINKYNDAINLVNETYVKALPSLEKAHDLKPGDIETMRYLQQIYYRAKQKDPIYEKKYSDIKFKIDTLSK